VREDPPVTWFQCAMAASVMSSLPGKWWKKLPLLTPAAAQRSSSVVAV